jgi:anthranilate synthase component 2
MILIIDNYDSFTYNLYQLFGKLNDDIKVVRNDKITLDEINDLNPSHIIISPGPGNPTNFRADQYSTTWDLSWSPRNISCLWW